MSNLKDGEKLWLPGGWAGDPGHAMLYCIEKVKNQYSFTIINTGKGIKFHSGYIHQEKEKRQLFFKINHISADKICQKEFCHALLELDSACHSVEFSEKNIYVGLVKYLGGEIEKGKDFKTDPGYYITPQRSGTCSMKVLFAALRYEILREAQMKGVSSKEALKLYKRLAFFYRRQSILDVCDIALNEQAWNRTYHKQISQVSTTWIKAAEKLHKQGIISEEELQRAEATVLDIRSQIHELNQKIKQKNKRSEVEPLNFSLATHTNTDVFKISNQSNISENDFLDNKPVITMRSIPKIEFNFSDSQPDIFVDQLKQYYSSRNFKLS